MLFSPLKTFRKSLAARIKANRHRLHRQRKHRSTVNAIERLEDRTLLSATIGGTVFDDTNGDGVQDVGEAGKAGVTVFLDQNQNNNLDAGELSTAIVTDTNGNYEFLGLAAGTYHVAQQLSNNELQTSPGQTTGPGLTGLVNREFASPAIASIGVTLANGSLYLGDRDQDVLFEIDPATGNTISTITLPVGDFWDFTFDGTNLWGADNGNDTIVKMDLSGNQLGSFPAPGTSPSGITYDGSSLWVSDSASDTIFELNPSDGSVIQSFASPNTFPLGLAFDGNHLWLNDIDDDLTYRIDRTDGSVLQSFVSPNDGGNILAGGIEFDNGELWIAQKNEALIFRMDSGITDTIDVTVSDGDISTGNNFGNFTAGTISGTVFDDSDGDGVVDVDEGGLDGWRLFIDQNSNGTFERWEISTISNTNGNYAFLNLKLGDYNVRQELRQPDWSNTAAPLDPITISTSGETNSNNDFGNQLNGLGPVGAEIRANSTTEFTFIPRPAVAADDAGNTVVAWSGTGLGATSGIFLQRYDSNGNAVGSEILVNSASPSNGCCPRVAMAAKTGEFSVVWGRGNDVLGRIYNSDGTPRTDVITLFQGNERDGAFPRGLAMDEDGDAVVIMHRDKTNMFTEHFFIFQRFNSLGELQGKAKTVVNVNLINGEGEIAMDANGNFVAAWNDAFDSGTVIRAQRYDSNGRAQGKAFDVAVEGVDRSVLGASISMKSTGEFAVSWFRTSNDGVVVQEAQIFEADGTFRGNSLSLGGSQSSQGDATFLPNGDLFFTWHSGNDILGRRFKSDGTGTPIDLEPFRINTTIDPVPIPGVPSRNPHVASDANGNLSVVWLGMQTGEDVGIYLQRFRNTNTPPPPTPGITVTPTTGLVTTEAGGIDSFSVALNTQPTADVTIGISSSDTAEGTVSTGTLVFTTGNWNVPQTVTVTGVDDSVRDGDIAYTIVTAAAVSADADYNGLDAADVSATNEDDEKGKPPKLMGETTGDGNDIIPLSQADAEMFAEFALQLWIGAEGISEVPHFDVIVADLPGNQLGMAAGNVITLDVDAAGVGWFVDATPFDNSEFDGEAARLFGTAGLLDAADSYDLLTAAAHEVGHALGFNHEHNGVMAETLSVGKRHLPGEEYHRETLVIPMFESNTQDNSISDDTLGTGVITSSQPFAEKIDYSLENDFDTSLTDNDLDASDPISYLPEEDLDADRFFIEFENSLLDDLLAIS